MCCATATPYAPVWSTLHELKYTGGGAMKKFLLAGVAALGLAGTASAADLPVAPVAYVPAFTWTGCYLGANGGWVGSDESYTSYAQASPIGFPAATQAATTNTYAPKSSSGTVGGQFGCQFQAGSWVFGGEWDWNWSGLKEDNVYTRVAGNPFNLPWTQITHKELDFFSTVRARIGLAWDRVLVYATGGLAYGGFDAYTHVDSLPGAVAGPEWVGAYDENRFGWTVGGGIEWAFANNWTAKAEFLYLDFGSFDYRSPRVLDVNPANDGQNWYTSVDAKEYVARVGINYLFHTGGAPVVARY